jgi:hypothetical protein
MFDKPVGALTWVNWGRLGLRPGAPTACDLILIVKLQYLTIDGSIPQVEQIFYQYKNSLNLGPGFNPKFYFSAATHAEEMINDDK